jgi:hypothetical protein
MMEAIDSQLFAEKSGPVFVILDGASVPGLPSKLSSLRPEHLCLHNGKLEPDMAEVAPYLAILEPHSSFSEWVLSNGWGKHWGIFGTAQADLQILKGHFRKFIVVHDQAGKSLYFRFYDPRVLRRYLSTCNAEELFAFFGPVTSYILEDARPEFARKFTMTKKAGQNNCINAGNGAPGIVFLESVLLKIPSHPIEQFSTLFLNDSQQTLEVSVLPTEMSGNRPSANGVTLFSNKQIKTLGDTIFAERMRCFLNQHFPESQGIASDELEQVILDLTERAAYYKLVLETHVAPFVVSAWLMGLNFDEKFISVKDVLGNLDMDSSAKAEWIWHWLQASLGILEDSSSLA